jgi:hypothetical protein
MCDMRGARCWRCTLGEDADRPACYANRNRRFCTPSHLFCVGASMSDAWYYVDSERAVGPIAVSELAHKLRSRPDWSSTLVWSEGLPDWQRAGEVADLKKWMITPPPVPSTPQPNATSALQKAESIDRKIRWRRPRNLAILSAATLYSLYYVGLSHYSLIVGLLSGLFAGLTMGALIVVIVEILASIADLLRRKLPRTAFYVGTIALWLGILVFLYFAGLAGYLIYQAAEIKYVLMLAGIGAFYGLLGWALQRGLAAGFRDVRKR